MDEKALVKICKLVLKKDKKKKKPKRKTIVKRIPFEDPTTRGAFPIAGRSGFGTYGRPFGFTPAFGSGTTIIAQDRPLEITKKPPVKFVGELTPEEERKFKKEIEEIIVQPKKIILTPDEYKISEDIEEMKKEIKKEKEITSELATDIIGRYSPEFITWGNIWNELTQPPSGGGGIVSESQRTEILEPTRNENITRAKEVLERFRMRKEDK